MRFLRCVLIVVISHGLLATAAEDAQTSIQQAIDAYQQALDETDRDRRVQLFRRAETLFDGVVSSQRLAETGQPINADLYFNQGNAALGAEHLGAAILAYRRALDTQPNHHRAKQNLLHARTLLPDWVPTPEDGGVAFGSFFDSAAAFDWKQLFGLAALAFFCAMLMTAGFLRTRKTWMRTMAILLGGCWCLTLAWGAADLDADSGRFAVVVVPEVVARSADSIHSPAKFRDPLPGGAEVLILDDRGDWARVRLNDGREAWLPVSSIEAV